MKSSILTGAQIGAGVAGIGSLFLPKSVEGAGKIATNYNKTQDWQRRLMAAAGGVGAGIMGLGWGQGENLTKKALKAADKDAYKYQESKEAQIQ